MLLSILNQYFTIKVYDGQPQPHSEVLYRPISGASMDELDQLHRKAVLWGVLVEADPSAEPAAPDSSRAECEVGTETGDIERPGDDDKVGGRIALEYHTVATSAHASLFLLQMDIHEQPSKRPRTGEDSSAPTVITSIEPTPTGPMPTMMTLPKLYVHACLALDASCWRLT